MNDSRPTETSTAPATVARLDGVSKHYGDVVALDGVDLEIRAGEVLALLGPNGAGKTTTVNLLLGLAQPTTGEATTFGVAPQAMAARMRVGAMLQISNVPETLTVREHLELWGSYYAAPLPLDETMALAGLHGLETRLFGKLSGGQKQRLLFALAVCGNPDLLFLDEPTVGLDVEARRELWGCVRRLVRAGKTVLLTTHHLDEADALAHRVVVVDHGRIVAEGTPTEVKGLVTGRTVRCATDLDAEAVAGWPGVETVARHGDTLTITARRPEPVVRRLLTADPALCDLEVTGARLEDALIAITGQAPDQHQEEAA